MRGRTESAGLVRIALAAVTWGTIPLLVRAVDAPPLVIVFWRVVFECAAIGVLLLVRRRFSEVARLSKRSLAVLAGQGLMLALNWVLFFTALAWTDVAVAEMLAYTGPVLVAVFAPLVLRDRFDRRILVPLALALAGTVFILTPGSLDTGPRALAGAAAAAASAFTYAFLVVNAKRLLSGFATDVYMFVETLAASVVLAPLALTMGQPTDGAQWGAVATLGVVHSALTGLLFLSGLRLVRADRAATLTYLEPASAVLFAALFLGEPVTVITLAGGAAIVGAGIIVARLAPAPASDQVPGF
ncbi:MAG: hypothetical protein C0418_03805 [Coriobacteriaceae bacterium]|nr:hypothetical protein [Coriobacteriaceae bacterium]